VILKKKNRFYCQFRLLNISISLCCLHRNKL